MVAITEATLSFQHLETLVQTVQHDAAGAVVTFQGTVRNASLGHSIQYLEYETYRPMAEQEMQRIVGQAQEKFAASCAAIHRVGRLQVGETSVIVAASSAHRAQAFEACRFVMDSIKKTVPIWKKEVAVDGQWWVEDPLGNSGAASKPEPVAAAKP
jgi:molybdopterin synthase catalytic subunit